MEQIQNPPSLRQINFLECAVNEAMEWRGAQMERLQFSHDMIMNCGWTEVPLSVLLDECGDNTNRLKIAHKDSFKLKRRLGYHFQK